MFNQIVCGNHLEILPRFPDDTFDMFLTSPPYDNLRSYEGYDFQFEPLARELYRVLKLGGVGVWVVNDATIDGSETLTSFKQALFFKNIGFNIHDTMIYCRESLPLTHNRYEQHFEYMFVLAKGTPVKFSPLLEKTLHAGERYLLASDSASTREHAGKLGGKSGKRTTFSQQKRRGNVWKYFVGFNLSTNDKAAFEHPAIFPEKLAEDHILSWSNPGDVVLDPMCGSGTTCKMAAKHGRKYVGIDIAEKYCEIARKRVALIEAQPMLFNEGAQANNAFAGDCEKAANSSVLNG